MKTHLTNIDIKSLVKEFKILISMRVNNVYDSNNNKGIIFKLNKTGEKQLLLIESGIRIHTLSGDFSVFRQMPTSFASKLRKHLKNKRLENIEQINDDRIIKFQFGTGEYINYLICEFYASGNIVLTDGDYKILSKIRNHIYDETNKFNYPINTKDVNINSGRGIIDYEIFKVWFLKCIADYPNKKLIEIMNFRDSPIKSYSPVLINHSLRLSGFTPSMKLNKLHLEMLIDNIKNFIKILKETFDKIYQNSEFLESNFKGYIVLKNKKYHEFTPYIFDQYKTQDIIEFETLNQALIEYYNSVKPLEHKITEVIQKKNKKKNKNDRKIDHLKNQVLGLEKKVDNNLEKAEFIQDNLDIIENLIDMFRGYLSLGLTKHEMITAVKEDFVLNDSSYIEIISVDLKDKKFIMSLKNSDIKLKQIQIEIYFMESAYDNITRYHQTKKHHRFKMEKAQQIAEDEQQKINKEKQKNKSKNKFNNISMELDLDYVNNKNEIEISPRKPNWFEQYHWFISNEGYLVILGKNAEQNEQIVKKYLEKDDIYVHADYHGSGSCVIKYNSKLLLGVGEEKLDENDERFIPISTIEQAGTFVLCLSKAWQSNICDRAYWVEANQVSKTAPSGEYLSTGSMMVRGKKNYLSMARLELFVGIIFKTKNSKEYKRNLNLKDQVTESLVMVSPITTLKNADFRVKLVPGQIKRGKSLKFIIDKFKNKTKKYICNEEPYIKNIKTTDLDVIVPQKSKPI